MLRKARLRSWSLVAMLVPLVAAVTAPLAEAQGFVSPSFGYNFAGDAGCPSATDCQDKNWNFGLSLGALGPIVGFEAELTYTDKFSGDSRNQSSAVTTVMGNFLVAPRISIVQPYGLAGIGLVKTDVDNRINGSSESKNQFGWTLGGGVIVFVNRHVGIKGDIRHYHAVRNLRIEHQSRAELRSAQCIPDAGSGDVVGLDRPGRQRRERRERAQRLRRFGRRPAPRLHQLGQPGA